MMINMLIGVLIILIIVWKDNYKWDLCWVTKERNDISFDRNSLKIKYFRRPEPFLREKDIDKFSLNRDIGTFNSELRSSAEKQKELNKSKKNIKRKIIRILRNIQICITEFLRRITLNDLIVMFVYIILPFVILGLVKTPQIYEFCIPLVDEVETVKFDMFFSQLSLTFITISVMSIFSDGNEVIYWQNVVKQKLIEPFASCFKAFFVYSFIYLLGSTISIFTDDVTGLIIFFFFNILCLFDLSRIMIGCYYGETSKKRKMIKGFIKKIERANMANSLNNNIENKYIQEVLDTFENLNFYTYDAYNNQKYITVRDNLSIYGKLLARVNPMILDSYEFPLLDWYDQKTYSAFIGFVKNYYKEYRSLILGEEYSTTAMLGNSIEKGVVNKILLDLCNDACKVSDSTDCYELVLQKVLIATYLIVRKMDFDNLKEYNLDLGSQKRFLPGEYEKQISRNMRIICEYFDKKEVIEIFLQLDWDNTIDFLLEGIILIDTRLLRVDWIPWESIKEPDLIMKRVKTNIENNIMNISQAQRGRYNYRVQQMEKLINRCLEQ